MLDLPGAWAIGPSDQKIADAPTPLSLRATGLLGRDAPIGTGAVVSAKRVGTTGFVAILTALHVATSQPSFLKLGDLIGGAAPWLQFDVGAAIKTFTYKDPAKNPKNLPADVALMLGTVNNLTDGSQALAKFNQLATNLPTIVDPAKDPGNPLLKATADNPVGFTQLGYGRQGAYKENIFIDANTVVTGYQAIGTSGERLFQNNEAREYLPADVIKDPITNADVYFHPRVRFNAIGPPNAQGQGLGMAGDSGGPLFTQAPANAVNVNVSRGGNNMQIPINYTDSLSAVFIASQSVVVTEVIDGVPFKVPYNPETVGRNAAQFAVPIDAALYQWIKPILANPMLVPEPASGVLTALVFGCWAARRGATNRRRRGAIE